MSLHKFRNLDGLRGVAALAVVLAHYAASFYPAMTEMGTQIHSRFDMSVEGTPFNLFIAGNFAVCLFFVLSGFVLSAKFFRTKSADVVISSAARRYLRLMLPALGSLVIIYVLLKIGAFKNLAAAQLTGSGLLAALWHYPMHLGDIINEGTVGVFKQSNPVGTNPPLWTLYYELIGSFLIFLILLLFGKLRQRWVFYIALCFAFQQSYYLAFILGIIISDIWHSESAIKAWLGRLSWPLLVIGLFLGAWIYSPTRGTLYNHFSLQDFTPVTLSVLAHTVGASFVIVAALSLASLKRVLETRPVQFLGRVSFSLYLLHFIVIGTYGSYLFNHLIHDYSYNVSFMIMFPLSLTLTFFASALYAKYVDQRSIQIAKSVGDKLISNESLGLRRLLGRDLRSFIPRKRTLAVFRRAD
jgi:peptidoglycan/LPS O-acetylase OafA/YrhL